jgi:cvfA/B/C family virulence factor
MAQLFIAYWRDIPAQVTASLPGGRRAQRVKRELSPRFAQAIDSAAMRSGATGTDAYLADWRQGEPTPCGEDIEAVVTAEAARLEREYDDVRLRMLIEAGGRESRGDQGGASTPGRS